MYLVFGSCFSLLVHICVTIYNHNFFLFLGLDSVTKFTRLGAFGLGTDLAGIVLTSVTLACLKNVFSDAELLFFSGDFLGEGS